MSMADGHVNELQTHQMVKRDNLEFASSTSER